MTSTGARLNHSPTKAERFLADRMGVWLLSASRANLSARNLAVLSRTACWSASYSVIASLPSRSGLFLKSPSARSSWWDFIVNVATPFAQTCREEVPRDRMPPSIGVDELEQHRSISFVPLYIVPPRRGSARVPPRRQYWHRFWMLLCLPTAPGLPLSGNGDFGTSAFFGLLSDKPLLARIRWCGGMDCKAQWLVKN